MTQLILVMESSCSVYVAFDKCIIEFGFLGVRQISKEWIHTCEGKETQYALGGQEWV